jgi:hypothetical protein
MGGMAMAMGKCVDIPKKKKSYITQTNCKHFQGGYGRLPLGDAYTCQRMHELEKIDSRTFFHKPTK